MKAADFDYARANSVEEACALLASAGGDGKLIAGGQSLVPLMAMRLARPSLLVDIARIAALRFVRLESAAVVIGAGTIQADALADATIRGHLPLLAKALAFVGHLQTRNRGTIGGSLAHGDPSAEIGLAALAAGAELVLRKTSETRRLAAADFFRGPMITALAPDECLIEICFPLPQAKARCGTGFQEVSIRRGDFALANAAACVTRAADGGCAAVALAIGGCGGVPLRVDAAAAALIGTKPGAPEIAAAARRVRELIAPEADAHVSADYRRRLAAVLAERALAEAFAEAA